MKLRKIIPFLFSVLLGILCSHSTMAQTVSIGTNPQGSLAYASGAIIAKVTTQATGLNFRVVPLGGPPVTIPAVNANRIDFALTASVATSYGYRGVELFKKANPNLRIVSVLYPIHMAMLVNKKSGIKSIKDLKGRNLASGLIKQKNVLRFTRAYLEFNGLTLDDVKGVPVPNFARGIEALQAGKVDSSISSVGAGLVAQANASISGGVRFLGIKGKDNDKAQKIINRLIPSAYIDTIDASPMNVGIEGPTKVLTQDLWLITSVDTPNELVYKVARALAENKAALQSAVGAFKDYNPQALEKGMIVPYHQGAIRFLKEKGVYK